MSKRRPGGDASPRVATHFRRHVGIDYSGAETAFSALAGLRVFAADGAAEASEVRPPSGPPRHWTRHMVAEWLVSIVLGGPPVAIGVDHGFSFPRAYFDRHGLAHDWPAFLDDFCRHWPTDEQAVYVDFVREGERGNGAARGGDARWRRVTEVRARAKSVFHFDVPGSVAKSTHAGLPWLRRLRRACGPRLHFWPFDGWEVPAGRSLIAEAYPSLWSRAHDREGRSADQHDAWSVATWLAAADLDDSLADALRAPGLTAEERRVAAFEGWILGVS